MVPKGAFWNIRENFFLVCYPIISYQRIKVYRVETMDMGRFHWNNRDRLKLNPSNECGTYCTGFG